jgi:hypothetical protein
MAVTQMQAVGDPPQQKHKILCNHETSKAKQISKHNTHLLLKQYYI